jgi:hypothetical protein
MIYFCSPFQPVGDRGLGCEPIIRCKGFISACLVLQPKKIPRR